MGRTKYRVSRTLSVMRGHRRRTAVRWQVVAAVFVLALITIIDRVCISSAKLGMAADLRITDVQFGWVFGVFTLGYAIMMVPAGWCGDRIGPRVFLTVIVCCWSLLTASTGFASALVPLIVIRFLFGLAEAGAYPTASLALFRWMPASERGLALGLLNTGSRLGAAIGLTIASYMIMWVGWRACFWLFGTVGLVWAALWYCWYRDDPARKSGVSAEELDYVRAVKTTDTTTPTADSGWAAVVLSLPGALLLFQYFANNFSLFLVYSWMLPYLQQRFQLGSGRAGVYSSLPMYCGVIATWMGGMIVDSLFRHRYGSWSRALPAVAGFVLASIGVMLAGMAANPAPFVICFGIVVLGLDLTVSSSWTVCSDLGGEHTGAVSGAMNMMGALGSFACSLTFPYVLRFSGQTKAFFWLAAALNAMAACCWFGLGQRLSRRTIRSSR
jgi:ACS family glucarate transporter-like MFS transporter